MLKKVLIASAAVGLALLAVSFVAPRRFADACHWLKERRNAAEESIPPEREIAVLEAKIKSLEKDDDYQFHHVAKLSVEVNGFEKTVSDFRARLGESNKRIGAMHVSLKAEGEFVNYADKQFSRDTLKNAFETAVDSYRLEEKQAVAMDRELAAKRQTLDLAKKNLQEMRLARTQLAADLATLRAEVELERRAAALERNVTSDPRSAEARERLETIRKRLNVMREERTLRRDMKAVGNPVEAAEKQKKQQEERDAYINQKWGAVNETGTKR